MTKINVYDDCAKRIEELAEIWGETEASIVDALFNLLDYEANMEDKSSVDLLGEHI